MAVAMRHVVLQFGTLFAAIRCSRPYGFGQYHRRETFQKKLASIHKTSVSEAATATDVFSRPYCCILESVVPEVGLGSMARGTLLRHGCLSHGELNALKVDF